jgi:hypothetical protein
MAYSGNPDAPYAAEVPAFPHLPQNVAHAIAAFDREVNTPILPLDSDGHPHIPDSAQAWIADNVRAHTHFDSED